ncbi:MAG: transposase family protein [Desulfosudis oleivorans]|nr:transposase family protein [Desulfosudis oleivorans]
MRDTELYQTLLGLASPWEVTAVNVTPAPADRPLGEIVLTVHWRADSPLVCPACGSPAPRYDSRPRRWRHLNTMQWKTFITAEVPRVNCLRCGVKQVRVAWAEDGSRFTEPLRGLRGSGLEGGPQQGPGAVAHRPFLGPGRPHHGARRRPRARAPLARRAHLRRAR